MKCPKCQYVGFEEADRCRHCGYDFSLATTGPLDAPLLREAGDGPLDFEMDRAGQAAPVLDAELPAWDSIRQTPETFRDFAPEAAGPAAPPARPRTASTRVTPRRETPPAMPQAAPVAAVAQPDARPDAEVDPGAPLPLFAVGEEDQPLVRLPAQPRRPVAVRRTPETPRLRAVPKPLAEVAERDLLFDEDDAADETSGDEREDLEPTRPAASTRAFSGRPALGGPGVTLVHEDGSLAARIGAAVVDHGLLAAIDLAVVYFTLRMAGLTLADWRMLPSVPLGLFLLLIGFSYFGVFTTFGGQTIGKMLFGIRVMPDPHLALDAARALRRTAAALVSLITLGLAYLPAGFGERRALHDRLTGTRVVRRRPS